MQRPCIDCGALIGAGSRCPKCLGAQERPRGRRWMKRRKVVFRRAGWICERCHERLAVEVHHEDGDPANNSFANLMACCHDCHVRMAQSLAWCGK
jgi:hypothetical protein